MQRRDVASTLIRRCLNVACMLGTLCIAGYPEDEAATYEMLLYRWKEAPDLTLAGFRGEEMIGVGNRKRKTVQTC